ncbi:MAG TPA: hypothetical protein VHS09_00580 [Polyangiaceae bacterium]|nr:hypothetical protein [Polyangiaceae bacterium]
MTVSTDELGARRLVSTTTLLRRENDGANRGRRASNRKSDVLFAPGRFAFRRSAFAISPGVFFAPDVSPRIESDDRTIVGATLGFPTTAPRFRGVAFVFAERHPRNRVTELQSSERLSAPDRRFPSCDFASHDT